MQRTPIKPKAPPGKASSQIKAHSEKAPESQKKWDGSDVFISTGSTLVDLAISGGRTKYGGIPGGVLVEIFGPTGSGKTVMLCEIAGGVQRQGGKIQFKDPEARLNKQFAQIFDLDVDEVDYSRPATVPEVFKPIRSWNPEPAGKIHGIFTDSLAALSTEMEQDDKDKTGMRRAKEFSEECRKTCATITDKNFLMVCSNQERQNVNAGPYAPKTSATGGTAIGYYSSLRLKFGNAQKIKEKRTVSGKEITKVVGVETDVEVFKSSVWEPYHKATICILFAYGIDDIRTNLQYVKDLTKGSGYCVGENKLSNSMNEAIVMVEEQNLEEELREQVISIWNEVEALFKMDRKKKSRNQE